jgi:DNA-binding transcriptional regulator LsrR (DeoR family)
VTTRPVGAPVRESAAVSGRARTRTPTGPQSARSREDPAAAYTAARLYYGDDLSQQEVAERLNVSRSTVSRLLQLARDTGIVRIEVRPPSPSAELSAELAQALELRSAVVVPAPARGGGVQALVTPALAELSALRLAPGSVLTTSSGEALWHIAQTQRFPDLRGVRLVPAVGGMDEVEIRFQPNEIARRIADASGADVSFLHVPVLPSATLRRSIMADPEIAARLALWDRLDAALVGIGAAPEQLVTGPSHIMAERAALSSAVGNVASRHFDLDGRPVEFADEARMLVVTRAQLKACGTVIAIAAGPIKVPSIIGAARAGLIDVLVTDAPTASRVIERLSAPRSASP